MIDPVTAASLGIKATSNEFVKVSVPGPSESARASGAGTFADTLASMGQSTMENLIKAENLSIGALRGDVGPREVAEAVMSAEQSLQVAIAVRDKIVSAYLEINRMAI